MTELTIIPSSGTALPAEPFRARHLIDGAWTDSADGAVSERHSPAPWRACQRRGKGRCGGDRSRHRGGAPGVRRGRLAPCVRQGPVGDLAENRRSDRTRHRPYRADRDTGIGQADYAGAGRDFRRGRPLALCGGAGADHAWREPQFAGARHAGPRPERAGRRGRHHLPVELPLPDRQPETALRARGRLHGGGEAVGADAVEHGDPRGTSAGSRAARWCAEYRFGLWRPGGRDAVHPSFGRHGVLHRVNRCRQTHRRGGQRHAEEGQPRTGRQEPAGHLPPTPISIRRPMRLPSASISTPANAAIPAAGSSCTRTWQARWSKRSWPFRARCRSAIRWTRARRWGRSSRPSIWARSTAT